MLGGVEELAGAEELGGVGELGVGYHGAGIPLSMGAEISLSCWPSWVSGDCVCGGLAHTGLVAWDDGREVGAELGEGVLGEGRWLDGVGLVARDFRAWACSA